MGVCFDCLVTVDGRQGSYSQGLTAVQMSQLFYDMGWTDGLPVIRPLVMDYARRFPPDAPNCSTCPK